jgi:alpha-galactosidase/6-phospho-beta-glucosidase family protein
VIEPPCRDGKDGPAAERVGSLPAAVRDLVVRVKAYERATIDATFSGSRDALVDALALNPLVASRAVASTVLDHLTLS